MRVDNRPPGLTVSARLTLGSNVRAARSLRESGRATDTVLLGHLKTLKDQSDLVADVTVCL